MRLSDINTTTFQSLDPEVQKALIDSTSNDWIFVVPVFLIIILALWSL